MQRTPTNLAKVDDPSRLFKVDYTIKYIECDLADKRIESKPVLQLFLSNHFVRNAETGGVVNIHLDEDNLQREYKGSLIGTLHRKHNDISPTAAIGMYSFVQRRNDSGYLGYVIAGTSHASIGTIMQDMQVKGRYDHTHDLMMRTVVVSGLEPVKKGVIEFRVDKVELGPSVKLSRAASCLQSHAIEQSIASYIQETMDIEMQLPDLLRNTERIRAPYDLSPSGIESTGQTFLPIAAFAVREVRPTNAEFWYNSFERVMARRNMSVSNYHDFDLKEKARTMSKMCCYVAQSLDYMGDAVELSNRNKPNDIRRHVGTDEFSGGDTGASDCEDYCDMNGSFHQSLSRHVVFDPDIEGGKYKPLIEMQEIARKYIYISTLSVVHGAKIGDEEGWGAHMVGIMIDMDTVKTMLGKTERGISLLNQLEPGVEPIGAAATFKGEKFPVMFCEGTGIIDTIGYKDPIIAARKKAAEHMLSIRGTKCEIPHEEFGESPFYAALETGITRNFFEMGINVGGLIFATHDPNNKAAPFKRGVYFADMLKCLDNIALIPQPSISNQIMTVIEEAVSIFPPPKPFTIKPEMPYLVQPKNPLLDKFVTSVKSFKRSGPDVRFYPSVDKFVRPHQFNENVINMAISDAAQFSDLYDAAYEIEYMTNAMCTYRLRMWIK